MSDMNKPTLIYVYPQRSTFILRDIQILGAHFLVKESFFAVKRKSLVPVQFIKQFFFLLFNLWHSKAVVCHFAGYSSLLPSILCKVFNKPCLIIVAGNDGAKFPDFNYGNYTRKLLGSVTGISLKYASQILPVHESLHYQNYDYYHGGAPAQGYSYFYPKAKNVPFTPVYYGYDSNAFKPKKDGVRRSNSYITIGNLSDPYCFKRKGYDLVIELAKQLPESHFTLVGWDGLTPIEIPPNVELLPFKSQHELIELFSTHQFYFQLSIMEGFPNALAEAMLCGCIPIGSDVSGIPYIISACGYILEKHTITHLLKLVASIDRSERNLSDLSERSRNRIKELFTYEIRCNKLIDRIYNDPRA